MRLYDNDDYQSMMRCSTILATALAHALYGDGILHGSEVPETVHKVLYSALSKPPDGLTFAQGAQRAARLALTIIRENGWQPSGMGGQGLFDRLIMDKGNYLLLSAAIAPDDKPWEGNLRAFFATTPELPAVVIPNSDGDVARRMQDLIERAKSGDEASDRHIRAIHALSRGDQVGGLNLLEQAARLGSAQAMKDAGDVCTELGKDVEARSWFEAAARAGNAVAMYNLGALAIQAGDRQIAAFWYQRAGEAGDPDGFAALTGLADEAGDSQGERHWARLGAEAGQAFCMFRHGLYLAMDAKGNTLMLRRAVGFVEVAAERGDINAMLLAGQVNKELGDAMRAQSWFDRARATGDPKALQMLGKHGL